jgi:NADH-quinone oxidoreductase subunit L
VIIAMHHEQDMRKMGGLYRYMPITWITSLVGSLALIGFPGTAGFYSKDAIIEAVHHSTLPYADWAYIAVLSGVFITALYTFRLFFLVFHGKERMDRHTWEHLRESPAVVTVPLSVLAIPSLVIGGCLIGSMLFGGYYADAIYVAPTHDVLAVIGEDYHGVWAFTLHAFQAAPVYLAFAGVLVAWLLYIRFPHIPGILVSRLDWIYQVLINKYWFDDFNQGVFAGGARKVGGLLWQVGDVKIIDGVLIDGTSQAIRWFSGKIRMIQSGHLYDYAFTMIIGLLLLIAVFVHHILR